MAKALGAAALVTGDVGGKRAVITVRNGADGAVKSAATFVAANPRALAVEVGRTFWQRLGSAVASSKVPSPGKRPRKEPGAHDDAPAAAARSENERKKESGVAPKRRATPSPLTARPIATPTRTARGRAVARASARARTRTSPPPPSRPRPGRAAGGSSWPSVPAGFSRNLTYNDQVSPGLRQYQLPIGPAAVLDVAFYPLALVLDGPAANIGLVAAVEQAVGTSSQLAADATFPNGATFPTSMREFAGGIRYRVPVGAWQIGAAVTGG